MASDKKPLPSAAVHNRRARYEYAISDEFESGMVLTGTEVKSLRRGDVNIADAYAAVKNEEIWLINSYIGVWSGGNRFNHEPRRHRKLLLSKKEIQKLLGKLKAKGVTLIPLSLYFNKRGYAKIKIGLATGKKQHEKRDTIKEREWEREKGRITKDKW